jgi:hypothetical protein
MWFLHGMKTNFSPSRSGNRRMDIANTHPAHMRQVLIWIQTSGIRRPISENPCVGHREPGSADINSARSGALRIAESVRQTIADSANFAAHHLLTGEMRQIGSSHEPRNSAPLDQTILINGGQKSLGAVQKARIPIKISGLSRFLWTARAGYVLFAKSRCIEGLLSWFPGSTIRPFGSGELSGVAG